MAGPDPKRMYLAINSQNIDALKAEKPYWSRPFVFLNPSGSGPKYTSLQAAMLLHKHRVVEFLIDQPSVDVAAKSTDGKSTLVIAVEAKMEVATLEKILQRLELRCLYDVDSTGKGPLDYAEPGSEVFDFLHSMGCKTREEKEAAMFNFFGEEVKGTVPGVSAHQRKRNKGATPRQKSDRKSGKRGSSASPSPASSPSGSPSSQYRGEEATSRASPSPASPSPSSQPDEGAEVVDNTWRPFDNIDDLEKALKAYIEEWGSDHEEGESCVQWLEGIDRARKGGKEAKLLKKWNASIADMHKESPPSAELLEKPGEEETAAADETQRGTGERRSSSEACSTSRHKSPRKSAVDPEAVKQFFAGRAEEQVNLKPRSNREIQHRITYVVTPRSASERPSGKRRDSAI